MIQHGAKVQNQLTKTDSEDARKIPNSPLRQFELKSRENERELVAKVDLLYSKLRFFETILDMRFLILNDGGKGARIYSWA